MQQMMTIKNLSAELGLSEYELRLGIKNGKYPYIRVGEKGGKYLLDKGQIEAILQKTSMENMLNCSNI